MIWPIVVFWLYRTKTIQEATFWTIIGAHMWLPVNVGIDLPVIPTFDKQSIPALAAWYACIKLAKSPINFFRLKGITRFLILTFLLSPMITVTLNQEPIIFDWGLVLPPESLYNTISVFLASCIKFLPFFFGIQLFRTTEHHIMLFRMLIIAGLIYSLFALFEIRISPQLHAWTYGFFPHEFGQQIRNGGYRAVVFMGHGLLVAVFLMASVLSAALFWKQHQFIKRFPPILVWAYLIIVMILQKSVASLLYSLVATVLIRFTTPMLTLSVARAIALIGLCYPLLCLMDIFPHQYLLDLSAGAGTERVESLQFRFDNEKLLLEHAKEKIFFGWGGFGRNRVYAEYASERYGTTDGQWIISLTAAGLVGFFGLFGLLILPIFKAVKTIQFTNSQIDKELLAAHTFLLAVILIDQLPNASVGGWTWLLVGSLLGRCEYINKNTKSNNKAELIQQMLRTNVSTKQI